MPFSLIFLLLLLSFDALGEARSPLADHPSPYLAMHADDAVQWRDWHPDLLVQARREGRMLFVSSGYFACHWCHVMQRESYQNREIAAVLNRFTIPVKIDRELLPALDSKLIDFVQQTRGHSGWPLNVFLTPEGHPLLGLLYAPPEDFLHLIENLEAHWREDPAKLTRLAREAMQETGDTDDRLPRPVVKGGDLLAAFDAAAGQLADEFEGGFGDQAKFPNAPQLRVMLELQASRPDASRARILRLTLRQMARMGLRDHLGGGFFRYTVDPGWREPHFEKMLYDNAQLLGLYARAAEVLQEPEWLQVTEDTFEFLRTTMRADNGGYISSLSALDEKGTEGGYYLWSLEELDLLLDEHERRLAGSWLGLQGNAVFAAGHLPLRSRVMDDAEDASGQEGRSLRKSLDKIEAKLLQARAGRVLPRDDKQLASWNGLLLQGMVELARVSGQGKHRSAARELRDFIRRELVDQDAVYRLRNKDGFSIAGDLEDYAQVAAGLLAWAEVTGSSEDRALARALVHEAWRMFYGTEGWRLTAVDLLALPTWQQVVADGPLPSPAATLLATSIRLMSGKEEAWPVTQALQRAAPYVRLDPFGHASHVPLLGKPGNGGDQSVR